MKTIVFLVVVVSLYISKGDGRKLRNIIVPKEDRETRINADCSSCGVLTVSTDRIVNGTEATPSSMPWIASVQYKWGDYHFCAGALIHSQWVLTAAHCTYGDIAEDLQVVLGEHELKVKEGSEITSLVSQIIIHENYNSSTYTSDIALLKLSCPMTCSDTVNTVCLPSTTWADREWDNTHEVKIAGWGTNKYVNGTAQMILMEAALHMSTRAVCTAKYGNWIDETMICAYEDWKDTCQGDSGGPMTFKDSDNKVYDIGVVSFGNGCALKDWPGVYNNVAYFISWIIEKTA